MVCFGLLWLALACFGLLWFALDVFGLLWLALAALAACAFRSIATQVYGGVLVLFFAVFRNFFDILTHLKLSCIFVTIFCNFSSIFGGFGRDFERIFGEFSVIFGDFFGKGETL